jgi:hypothetical protein
MTVHELELTGFDAETVLVPDEHGGVVDAIRITVHGPSFPQRALIPELRVGDVRAQLVSIAADGQSLRGYLRQRPRERSAIVVRYGSSQWGTIRRAFRRRRVRPLPKGCQQR